MISRVQFNSSWRSTVLQLYRNILRTGQQWQAAVPENTDEEQKYIKEEARKLFKQNINVLQVYICFIRFIINFVILRSSRQLRLQQD